LTRDIDCAGSGLNTHKAVAAVTAVTRAFMIDPL
jgi:hypothetical protein